MKKLVITHGLMSNGQSGTGRKTELDALDEQIAREEELRRQ
ncbi:hypothetical protein ECOK1357_5168, partial [Escherichia coli OK1357]